MDILPKKNIYSKAKPSDELTDAEKLEIAIKKVKLAKARKAVNNSFNRSVGSLKRWKKKRQNAHSQSFVLRQASALEQKNKDIVAALAKARHYSSQLERVNYYFKEQQLSFAMKIASYKRKLRDSNALYEQMKSQLISKDELLENVQDQLSTVLSAIQIVRNQPDPSATSDTSCLIRRPLRVIKKGQTAELDDQNSSSSEDESHSASPQPDNSACVKSRKIEKPSPDLSVLQEGDAGSSDDELSEDEAFQRLEMSLMGKTMDDRSDNAEIAKDLNSTGSTEWMEVNEGSELNENMADVHSTRIETTVVDRLCPSTNEETRGVKDQSSVNLDLNLSFSSTSSCVSDYAGDDIPSVMNSKKPCDETTYSTILMELTCTNMENVRTETNEQNDEVVYGKEDAMVTKGGVQKPEERKKSVRKKRASALSETGNKKTSQQIRRKKSADNKENTGHDIFSCSSDSFVLDPNKCIKLNSSKSFSPVKLKKALSDHRHSEPGNVNDENIEPRRACRRRGAVVSYAEPNLNAKLRRGDRIADDTFCNTFSPGKSGKRIVKKRKKKSK